VGAFGTAAAFSFCTDKIMTTGGEGGMLVTSDEKIWQYAWSYKDHGKSWAQVHRTDHLPGFRWLHESFGTNWRLTEMQSAIGRVQLGKLDAWLAVRRRNAELFAELLRGESALRVPEPEPPVSPAWYKFYCFVRPEALAEGWSRDRILAETGARGMACFSGSCPEIYLERAFAASDSRPPKRLSEARRLGETSLMLLVDPCQTVERIERTAETLLRVVRKAARATARSSVTTRPRRRAPRRRD
jgi:dTDP-4-amino-4,6-dideoxygalactose transaminase